MLTRVPARDGQAGKAVCQVAGGSSIDDIFGIGRGYTAPDLTPAVSRAKLPPSQTQVCTPINLPLSKEAK